MTYDEPVQFVDLAAQHAEIARAFEIGLQEVIATTSFIGGTAVSAFEAEYAHFCGVRHCVGVANGTDAIELALRTAGIGSGDEVIMPANTFVATAEAVVRSGASPVLVDMDPTTYLLDTDQVLDRLGPRTRAVIPVHLYGQMAPMSELATALAAREDVVVVEDAAQAHGATQQGLGPGATSLAASTSFYPGKNLGAYGDAGAVLTNDDALAGQLRRMRDHGSDAKYVHEIAGCNSRLDSIQAVVLSAKLTHLARWNEARQDAAARYDSMLADVADVGRPIIVPGNTHVWHLYVVQVPKRDAVLTALREAGIAAGVHYPVPVHLQPAFACLGVGKGALPRCEAAADRIVSLPIHPHIAPGQQERVAEVLTSVLGSV